MADAGVRRHHFKVFKAFLSPFQQRVPFLISLILFCHIFGDGTAGSVIIHLHRMIHNKFHGGQRIDLARVTSQSLDRITHGCQIHDRRDPVKSCMSTRAG